jgi:hypothetical protein
MILCVCVCESPEIKPRALHVLSKYPVSKLNPQSKVKYSDHLLFIEILVYNLLSLSSIPFQKIDKKDLYLDLWWL